MSDTPSSGPYPEDSEISLRDIWNVVRRNRLLVLGTTVGMIVAAGLFTWWQTPVYESTATVRIDSNDSQLSLLGDLPKGLGSGKDAIATDILVLESRQIAEAVVDSLKLQVQLVQPSRPRSSVLQVIEVPDDAVTGSYLFERNGSEFSLRSAESNGRPASSSRLKVGQSTRVGGVLLALDPSLEEDAVEEIRIIVKPRRDVVEELQRRLNAARPDPNAQIVSVSYRSTDSVLAAAVPNTAMDRFIDFKARSSSIQSRSMTDFLQGQVSSYQQQLYEAEAELQRFRETAQVINPVEEATAQIKRLAELRAERDALKAERDAIAQLLAEIRNGQGSSYRRLASFPVFLANRAVQDILQSITQLENQRAELLVRRTTENIDVQGINERIKELEHQLFTTAQSYLSSLESQLASLNANLARFGNQLEEIPAREVQFARRMRQQKVLEELYTLLQARLKEAEIQQAIVPGDVRMIDPALVPERAVTPRPIRNLALAGVFGLLLGFGGAFTREALDNKVRTHEDVQTITQGVNVLGTIPRIHIRDSGGNGTSRKRLGRVVPISAKEMLDERLVTRRDPRSPISEAYRALRTSITFSGLDRSPQIIVVTSALPGEGKSTSSSNLAITLAQQGTRTLLVDADLRKGLLHRLFDVKQDPGLTHVLTQRSSLADAVQEISTGDSGVPLDFLASGVFPPNPSEMLGSERMRTLLEEMRSAYEAVVFDMPPLNLVTDAALLGRSSDIVLIVTRAGHTEREALQFATAHLRRVKAPIGGVILNDFDLKGAGQYGGYGYYAYGTEAGNGNGR